MAIEIIGAGFGRTGTLSLKFALEKLGYDKTYHMMELIATPEHLKHWQQLEAGGEPDWDELFENYKASVDFPGCIYYKEMMKRYPNAKVILTVRDPEKWYKSCSDTIAKDMPPVATAIMSVVSLVNPKLRKMMGVFRFAKKTVWKRFFQDRFHSDKEFAMKVFTDFNEEVKKFVPADKLLVFEVKDGWAPLCKFLNKAVPLESFPKVNDTEEFNNRRKIFARKRKVQEQV
jgi:hypothetical protein